MLRFPSVWKVFCVNNFVNICFFSGYQTVFSQLAFGSKKDSDPFSEVVYPKEFLAKQLYHLSVKIPGKVGNLITFLSMSQCMI